MVALNRIRCTWDGWSGAPGVSTFYFADNSTGVPDALHQFFEGFKNYIPSPITITVPNSGDQIEDGTGQLVGQWSQGTGGVTTCSNTTATSAAQGAQITWNTAGIHNGRHLRGRTFLVPFSFDAYGPDGLLKTVAQTTLQQAANALVGAGNTGLRVWGRPKGGTGGTSSQIVSGTAPRKVVVLRSRRD